MPTEIYNEETGEWEKPEAAERATRGGALPVGTVITGKSLRGGLFTVGYHKDHLFQIESEPIEVDWSDAGYQQQVLCLVDGERWLHVDGGFLQIAASKDRIRACLEVVTDSIQELRAAKSTLEGML